MGERSEAANDRELFWAAWAVTAAFGSYFCMYAFRKPFTAASYAGTPVAGIEFKTVLVIAQVMGYALSKFVGIKIVAEMPPERRAVGVLVLVLFAEAALILFGVVPRPWNALCLFVNGMPLGMVFGLVVGMLEGRRLTEALTAGLCASFILADGVTKSLGAELLARGVSEEWMPATAGALFLLPFAGCVAMLAWVPPPSRRDVAERAERGTLTRSDRWGLLRRAAPGLVPIMLVYLLATILRSVRADFAPEIWRGLGYAVVPATFTQSELLVALGVLAANGAAVLLRDNRLAFFTAIGTCGLGLALLAAALLGRSYGLGGFGFMVLTGLGLYLPYVAIHTTVFERFLAMTRDRGTVGFLMTVADAVGYLGYVGVMLWRSFGPAPESLLETFVTDCWLTVVVSSLLLAGSVLYFAMRVPSIREEP